MALIEQSYLQCLLNEIEADFGRQQKQAQVAVVKRLNEIQKILKRNVQQTFTNFSLETIVRFMQFSVEIEQKFSFAEDFVNLFFQRITAPSQYYIRALLIKSKLITYKGHKKELKGESMLVILKESILQINKALDLISGGNEPAQKGKQSKSSGVDNNKVKYGFLIYNASTCLYKIIRFMLKSNWLKNFTDIVERIYKLFEEVDEPDQNWKCRFMLILFQCLYDNQKKPDAWKILDLLWERAKSKNVDFLDSLFRLRVHYSKQNSSLTNSIKKDVEGADPNGWKILQALQRMKSGSIPEAQVEKQLMGVVNQISLGVLSNNEQGASVALNHVMQERLGQAGRIALKFNIINIASSITNFLAKARQPNQKAMVLNQYNKAQLLIKKKNEFIDKKTGMMMNATQIKQLEIQRRKQALRILEKVMLANKKLDNADLIYEGAILIWNICLPFLCPQHRQSIAKAFDLSCHLLEQIDSTDHQLRTKMHLELAKVYFGNQKMFPEMEANITKALKLDHSIHSARVTHKFQPSQDPSLYYRPFEKYLHSFREKIMLKSLQIFDRSQLDNVINDLWNVAEQKSETTRIDTLQKCLKILVTVPNQKYIVDESKMLVEQEIEQQKILFEQKKLREYKKRKLLAYQVAELSFEWQLNDFAKKAAKFVLQDKWQAKNSSQLLIAQARCCYYLAQIQIDELIQDNYEIPFAEHLYYQAEQGKDQEIDQEKKTKIEQRKVKVFEYFTKGLEISESIQQHWLVFNGAIYIWNNFLHVFRNPGNDSKLHKNLGALMKKFFESMKNSLKQIELKGIVYYDLDIKIQTFANIGLTYARLMQNQKQPQEVIKICEALLITPLSPHSRKLTNSMKARVTGSGGKAAGGKDQKKGGKDAPQDKNGGTSDSFLFDVFNQLQIIQNSTNKTQTENLIKKCFENLQNWEPKDKDESQLQLHAELWARLARLAVNQNTSTMFKFALRCSQNSLSLLQNDKNISSIPSNRLRWYSLSEFLYSDCLMKIANPETQDTQSYEKLLFAGLQHAVQATYKGYKSNINALVVDGAKQVWNISSKLQESQKNRIRLIEPLKTVLYYLKEIKEQNEIDLILLLAQLFFKSANENNQNKVGQEVADMLFNLVPKTMQKSLWEAKMVFMSKQGKNQLQALSNMKEADPSLQSKLWVKLARISSNPKKQHAAYNKAIQILKKQNSVQIVETLIQYSEWQLRVGNQKVKNVTWNLLLASDFLIDIEYGQEDDEDDGEQDKGTVFSRSTRGKKSHTSKSMKSSLQSSKMKKVSQKKGTNSIKSKSGSSYSRMNRSGRVAKASKSKNSKSIFSQRQQDPNPESLNCIHFERLFRIHTILSMISDSVVNRIRYALDAKQFIVKILDLSFNTINQIQENSLKFSQKNKSSEDQPKLKMPSNLSEWVNFEISKEIIDRVKTLEDPNFMGTYTFQKPELTFIYLKNLSQILNSYGLNYHSIPIFVIQKFIAAEILCNKNYFEVVDLEMKLILRKIGYTDPSRPEVTKINPDKYTISELDLKMESIKTQSKIVPKNDENIFKSIQPPSLVQPFTNHEAWFELGKLLSRFGKILIAKKYLKQAHKHFVSLGKNELAGECCIQLLKICAIQGENDEGMQYALSANKLCKQSKNWRNLLFHSCRLLLSLKKYEDIASFAGKVYSTVEELILSLDKQNRQKLMLESQILQLKDIIILVQIIDLDVRFTESYLQEMMNPTKGILSAIKQLEDRISSGDIWTLDSYKYFYEVSRMIVEFFIFGKEKGTHIGNVVLEKVFALLLKIEKALFQLIKYTLVNSDQQFRKNELISVYQSYRYLIANSYSYHSSQQINGQSILNSEQDEENRDEVMSMIDPTNDHFKKFMDTLNLEIQKQMKPVPSNLSPIESSISILENSKGNIIDDYGYVEWSVYYAKTLTLRARASGSLEPLWIIRNSIEGQEQQIQSEQAIASLDFMTQFLQNGLEEKMINFSQNSKCYDLAQQLYEAFVENTGQQMSDKCFEFLCKLQHYSYTNKILDQLQKNLHPSHKLMAFLNLINKTNLDTTKSNQILSKDKIFTSLSQFQKYEECLAIVPKNSIYVVIQMNCNLSEIYCGIMCNEKNDDEYQISTKTLKTKIEKHDIMTYLLLKEKLNKIKKQISYLPYSDPQKFSLLLQEKQNNLQDIQNKFNKLSAWWLDSLVSIVNKQKQQQTPVEVDKNKKGAKDTKKKAGKDQISGYESPLGASPAGFESITFLIDQFFDGFSFHLLPGLETIPAISYDSSIFYLSRKMKSIGFKPQVNNSNGFGVDKGKYVSYEFKNPDVGFKALSTEIIKQSSSFKFEGISSSDRIPSIGDLKKYLNEPGFLQIYGALDVMNSIKLPLFLESCGNAKVKLLLICDHLNYEKGLINKFSPLDNENQPNSIDQQSHLWKIVANLLDINIIKNNWSSSKEHNKAIILSIYKNLGLSNYLGACLKNEEGARIVEKSMNWVHGCPVLRM